MPDLTTIIAGALLTLPALLLIVSGQLYLLHGKVKPMSLLQDAEAVIERVEAKIEAAFAPLHDKILQLEAEVAEALSAKDALLADKDALLARLEAFGEKIVGLVAPGETAAPQPEQPAP